MIFLFFIFFIFFLCDFFLQLNHQSCVMVSGRLSLWLSFWEILRGNFLFDCSSWRKYTCRQVCFLFILQINEILLTVKTHKKFWKYAQEWRLQDPFFFFFNMYISHLRWKNLWISSLFCCSAAQDSQRDLHIILRCWVGHVTCF